MFERLDYEQNAQDNKDCGVGYDSYVLQSIEARVARQCLGLTNLHDKTTKLVNQEPVIESRKNEPVAK